MEAYIEYLNETEYSFNSEFDNYLKGKINLSRSPSSNLITRTLLELL